MNLFSFFVLASSIISAFLCGVCPNINYSMMALLPIAFLIIFYQLSRAYDYNNIRLTILVVGACLWFRMVLIPLLGACDSSYFNKVNTENDAVKISMYLCLYESLVISFIIYFLSGTKYVHRNRTKVLYGSKMVYALFILIAFVVYLSVGQKYHIFEFAIKAIGTGERGEEELDAKILLIRQIIGSGMLFAFFCLVEKCRLKFCQSSKSIYVIYALVGAMFMVCIITGERRTSQIYIAFSACWLLIHVFPRFKKKITVTILFVGAFVLVMMSIYKHLNAFLYDSYTEALEHGDVGEGFSATMFDAYFYGVNTISKNIEFGKITDLSLFNFLYDIMRCTFGLNLFVPRDIHLTSEVYNLYMYGGYQTHGYLLSSVGYGYIYFGLVLAPVVTFVNVFLLSFIEKRLKNAGSIEMTYIWAFIIMRFGFGILGSLPPLVSLCTRYIFFNGALYLLAKKINNR